MLWFFKQLFTVDQEIFAETISLETNVFRLQRKRVHTSDTTRISLQTESSFSLKKIAGRKYYPLFHIEFLFSELSFGEEKQRRKYYPLFTRLSFENA